MFRYSILSILVSSAFLFAESALLRCTDNAAASNVKNFTSCLQKYSTGSSSSKIEWTSCSDSNFNTLNNKRYNKGYPSRKPSAFALPKNSADLSAILSCVSSAKLNWTVRSGGNSYEDQSTNTGGVVIPLDGINYIDMSKLSSKKVTVGASVRLGQVYAALIPYNLTFGAGNGAGVGVSGYTLGGGVGHSIRRYGPLCDYIVGAKAMLVNGTVLQLSSTQNSDLFWAIKGGGPHYAIVLEWTFTVSVAPASVVKVSYSWDQSGVKKAWEAYWAWQPWKLSYLYSDVKLKMWGSGASFSMYYYGPRSVVDTLIASSSFFKDTTLGRTGGSVTVKSFNDHLLDVIGKGNWTSVNSTKLTYPTAWKNLGIMIKSQFNSTAHQIIYNMMQKYNSTNGFYINAISMGGNMTDASRTKTTSAWPHRNKIMNLRLSATDSSIPNTQWMPETADKLKPWSGSTGNLFYNYIYCPLKDPHNAFYGFEDFASKLLQVKSRYDPKNKIPLPCGVN